MNEQIHELRIRIDGLAQLVKSLDKPVLIIEKSNLPYDMSMEDIINPMSTCGQIMKVPEDSKVEYIGPSLSFLAESYKSLLLSKAWLVKVLAELGEETPYKNEGNRKTVEDIEPTADTKSSGYLFAGVGQKFWYDKNYIEKIDWLREEVGKIARDVEIKVIVGLFSEMIWKHLTEARFHLGFELSKMRDEKLKNNQINNSHEQIN